MSFSFTDEDIKAISGVLGQKAKDLENAWSWRLQNKGNNQPIAVSIHNEVGLGQDRQGSLVSVQTQHGYYEMHDVAAFLTFEPDEIIFINANGAFVSSLIIGKLGTCSMYSNISRDILSADFANLDPVVLLSAMQLSLTEGILPE
jgi:hypothetical protein